MLARRKKDGYYDVFEIKSYSTAAECIREALGQILFYKYLLTESECDIGTLFIVGQNEMSDEEERYFSMIKNSLNCPIEYIPIKL